jgi:TRAP-type C4-dicarboxylate transport system permease small subunit
MILAMGRYAALVGLTFAALLHLVGYLYLDLRYEAFETPALGISLWCRSLFAGPSSTAIRR